MGVRCMKGLITVIRIRIRSKSRIKPQSRACLAGNRDNQPAVAGLLGWPIVTITINPRSRGCLAGPWFAMRDRDIVCATSEVKNNQHC